jgi:hypothetical protein
MIDARIAADLISEATLRVGRISAVAEALAYVPDAGALGHALLALPPERYAPYHKAIARAALSASDRYKTWRIQQVLTRIRTPQDLLNCLDAYGEHAPSVVAALSGDEGLEVSLDRVMPIATPDEAAAIARRFGAMLIATPESRKLARMLLTRSRVRVPSAEIARFFRPGVGTIDERSLGGDEVAAHFMVWCATEPDVALLRAGIRGRMARLEQPTFRVLPAIVATLMSDPTTEPLILDFLEGVTPPQVGWLLISDSRDPYMFESRSPVVALAALWALDAADSPGAVRLADVITRALDSPADPPARIAQIAAAIALGDRVPIASVMRHTAEPLREVRVMLAMHVWANDVLDERAAVALLNGLAQATDDEVRLLAADSDWSASLRVPANQAVYRAAHEAMRSRIPSAQIVAAAIAHNARAVRTAD